MKHKGGTAADETVHKDHHYEPTTQFCKRCGMHREMVVADDFLCVSGPNVIAISHIRALQIMGYALAAARE